MAKLKTGHLQFKIWGALLENNANFSFLKVNWI